MPLFLLILQGVLGAETLPRKTRRCPDPGSPRAESQTGPFRNRPPHFQRRNLFGAFRASGWSRGMLRPGGDQESAVRRNRDGPRPASSPAVRREEGLYLRNGGDQLPLEKMASEEPFRRTPVSGVRGTLPEQHPADEGVRDPDRFGIPGGFPGIRGNPGPIEGNVVWHQGASNSDFFPCRPVQTASHPSPVRPVHRRSRRLDRPFPESGGNDRDRGFRGPHQCRLHRCTSVRTPRLFRPPVHQGPRGRLGFTRLAVPGRGGSEDPGRMGPFREASVTAPRKAGGECGCDHGVSMGRHRLWGFGRVPRKELPASRTRNRAAFVPS